ncbi:hypothetical protein Ahy_B01g054790 isoform A [Arachis hypogaea]|uniref:Retrotransposon gag domain-containing protein n=1 Tax=Arachis hypogaea TaxID=3818 RepID=A0A445AUA6_ARAHY|nr:hypothetical protein Ahy_B01g054790 isoform A [Arachis hypogaea]
MIEYYDSDDEGSSYAKKSSQFQIPAFKGRNDPEAYFRWERKVESIFANCILSEEKKVQLVQANFFNAARIWWTELGRSRRRYGKRPICSWEKMKKIMRRQFVPSSHHMRNRVVPSSYHNEFFGRFCKLEQGSQSVIEYHKEFLYLTDKANIKRSPRVLMDRFLFGLREELADEVQRYRYTTMDNLVNLAIDWEQVQQMIDRHNKRNSSTPIFHSSSKPEMEQFVEYAVEGDVSLEDSTVQNFSTGGIKMDEKEESQIAHLGQDGKSMVGKIELAHLKDITTIQWMEKSQQTMEIGFGFLGGTNSISFKIRGRICLKRERMIRISYAKKSSQFQIPAFKGRNDLEAYCRWERKVESIFANWILSEEKKVQLVQANFFNAARIWWTELGRSRRRYGKRPICSWEKMKKIMRRQFVPSSHHMRNRVVPSSYHNEFFGRFCKLEQGSQSVIEYHKEFLYLMDKANIKRSPKVLMDRFLFGLREELADEVQRYRYTTMDNLVNLAIAWEQVQQMIDLHNKRNSSTPIFHSSSKPEMKQFVEYAVEGDVSLEDSTVQNFSTGGIKMDEKEESQIAHLGQDGKSMVGKIELAHLKDITTIQWMEKSQQTMVFEPGDWRH